MVEVNELSLCLKRGYDIIIDKNVDFYSGFILSKSSEGEGIDSKDFDGVSLLVDFPNIMKEIEIWGEYLNITYNEENCMIQSRIQKLGSSGLYLDGTTHEVVNGLENTDEDFLLSLHGLEEKISKKSIDSYPILKKER